MSTENRHESAKIYQFPRKLPRSASESQRGAYGAVETAGPVYPTVEFGSGWYHTAAMQEAERARKP